MSESHRVDRQPLSTAIMLRPLVHNPAILCPAEQLSINAN